MTAVSQNVMFWGLNVTRNGLRIAVNDAMGMGSDYRRHGFSTYVLDVAGRRRL